MRSFPRPAGVLVAAVLGLAGVGVAHALEYVALTPAPGERADVLAATGHHYLPTAMTAIGFFALMALAVTFLAAFRRGTDRGAPAAAAAAAPAGTDRNPPNWAHVLPVAQALAFVVLEIGERLAAGSSLADLGPVLVLGLPLQVLAGIAGGRLLVTVARAGEHLGRLVAGRLPSVRRRTGASWRPIVTPRPASALAGGPTPARGPPSLLALD